MEYIDLWSLLKTARRVFDRSAFTVAMRKVGVNYGDEMWTS